MTTKKERIINELKNSKYEIRKALALLEEGKVITAYRELSMFYDVLASKIDAEYSD